MLLLLRKFLPFWLVLRLYVQSGAIFGDAVSSISLGECVGFKKLFSRWEKWEAEYARRGYRTVSLEEFVDYGGYGVQISHLEEKRESCEKPVLYASIYRKLFLGRIKPAINLEELMQTGQVQSGSCVIPSIPRLRADNELYRKIMSEKAT